MYDPYTFEYLSLWDLKLANNWDTLTSDREEWRRLTASGVGVVCVSFFKKRQVVQLS